MLFRGAPKPATAKRATIGSEEVSRGCAPASVRAIVNKACRQVSKVARLIRACYLARSTNDWPSVGVVTSDGGDFTGGSSDSGPKKKRKSCWSNIMHWIRPKSDEGDRYRGIMEPSNEDEISVLIIEQAPHSKIPLSHLEAPDNALSIEGGDEELKIAVERECEWSEVHSQYSYSSQFGSNEKSQNVNFELDVPSIVDDESSPIENRSLDVVTIANANANCCAFQIWKIIFAVFVILRRKFIENLPILLHYTRKVINWSEIAIQAMLCIVGSSWIIKIVVSITFRLLNLILNVIDDGFVKNQPLMKSLKSRAKEQGRTLLILSAMRGAFGLLLWILHYFFHFFGINITEQLNHLIQLCKRAIF